MKVSKNNGKRMGGEGGEWGWNARDFEGVDFGVFVVNFGGDVTFWV